MTTPQPNFSNIQRLKEAVMGSVANSIGHGGAGGNSSYYPNPVDDGTTGSSAANQPPPEQVKEDQGIMANILHTIAIQLKKLIFTPETHPTSLSGYHIGCGPPPFVSSTSKPSLVVSIDSVPPESESSTLYLESPVTCFPFRAKSLPGVSTKGLCLSKQDAVAMTAFDTDGNGFNGEELFQLNMGFDFKKRDKAASIASSAADGWGYDHNLLPHDFFLKLAELPCGTPTLWNWSMDLHSMDLGFEENRLIDTHLDLRWNMDGVDFTVLSAIVFLYPKTQPGKVFERFHGDLYDNSPHAFVHTVYSGKVGSIISWEMPEGIDKNFEVGLELYYEKHFVMRMCVFVNDPPTLKEKYDRSQYYEWRVIPKP